MDVKSKRTIIIIGASTGIGFQTAVSLSEKFNVIATVRKETDLHKWHDLSITAYQLDTANLNSIKPIIQKIFEENNFNIDAIFINAGYGQPGAVEDLPLDALRKQFDVNLFAPFEIAKGVIPYFRRKGAGKIIINSSVLGFISLPYRFAYSSSKHALEAMASTLRLELKNTDISVSVIQPGPIDTRFRHTSFMMFKKNIDESRSFHQSQYNLMNKRLSSDKPTSRFTLHPSNCSSVVHKILCSSNPKNYYRVTFPTKVFYLLSKVLPSKIMDKILNKSF